MPIAKTIVDTYSWYPNVKPAALDLALLIFNSLVDYQSDWFSVPAVQLDLGTCAVESNFGYYRKQIKGPARGIFQIEPTTAVDIFDRFIQRRYPDLYKNILKDFLPPEYPKLLLGQRKECIGQTMVNCDILSILICRAKYRENKMPIPHDLPGIASVWKKVYNTYLGKGTPEKFQEKYIKYIGDFNEMNLFLTKYSEGTGLIKPI